MMDKLRIKSSKMIVMALGAIWITFGMSCEKVEFTRSPERDTHATRVGDSVSIEGEPSISHELESDSLEDEVEEIYFYAED